MAEKHPFGIFVPINTHYLFLGSFTGQAVEGYDWFFSNKRSQFWPIIESVYDLKLPTKKEKQELFEKLGIAITDIILECDRRDRNNLDQNLINMIFNTEAINEIISKNKIKTIYFSSRFAEKLFKKHFQNIIKTNQVIEMITLPSPSPRYAAMSKLQKIAKYKELLPKM